MLASYQIRKGKSWDSFRGLEPALTKRTGRGDASERGGLGHWRGSGHGRGPGIEPRAAGASRGSTRAALSSTEKECLQQGAMVTGPRVV